MTWFVVIVTLAIAGYIGFHILLLSMFSQIGRARFLVADDRQTAIYLSESFQKGKVDPQWLESVGLIPENGYKPESFPGANFMLVWSLEYEATYALLLFSADEKVKRFVYTTFQDFDLKTSDDASELRFPTAPDQLLQTFDAASFNELWIHHQKTVEQFKQQGQKPVTRFPSFGEAAEANTHKQIAYLRSRWGWWLILPIQALIPNTTRHNVPVPAQVPRRT